MSIRERLRSVALELRETNGSSITVGLAEMRPLESLEELLARADAAMIAQRSRTREGNMYLRSGDDRRLSVREGADNGGQRRAGPSRP